MKTIVILAAAALAFTGCNKAEQAEKDRIEQEKETQKAALNQQKSDVERSSEQAKDQVTAEAKMEKKRIEDQADAQKAALNEEKKQVEDQADAAKKNVNEAAGAAKSAVGDLRGLNPGFRGANSLSPADMTLKESITKAWDNNADAKNVSVSVMDGKVTLMGSVRTEAMKNNLEKGAKAMPGVKSVDNKLEVSNP